MSELIGAEKMDARVCPLLKAHGVHFPSFMGLHYHDDQGFPGTKCSSTDLRDITNKPAIDQCVLCPYDICWEDCDGPHGKRKWRELTGVKG